MKRKRETEKMSELRSAIEELSMLAKVQPGDNRDAAYVPTKPFLNVSTLILQVLDKIGPTMAVLRQDIHQNIQDTRATFQQTLHFLLYFGGFTNFSMGVSVHRLEILCESDPTKYSNLIEMLKKEDSEGNTRKGTSCSRACLWLTRSMDFMVALLQRLVKDPGHNMEHAVEESYNVTLKPWHGWISSAAFKVALKLVPDNRTFISLLMTKDQNCDNLKDDMQTLISLLVPLLEEIHAILRFYRLDRIKST